MNNKMKAAIMHKPGDIRIEEIVIPKINSNEVLIKIKAVGVCGSDIHYFKHGHIGDFVVEKPLILGHESAGEIVEVGGEVKNWKIGDRVAIEPGVPCRKCQFCKEGRYNLCEDEAFMATPPFDGAFTEYVSYPPDFIFKLPNSISYEEGAMMEPLSVGVYATKKGNVQPGKTVAILGMGTIGLTTLQSVRAFGSSSIIVSDIEKMHLDFAKKYGADYALNAEETDIVKDIKKITNREGVDIVFETAGVAKTCKQSISIVKKGGTIVLVGNQAQGRIDLDVISIICKELNIQSVFRYANMYPTCINLVAMKKVDVKGMISKYFKLEEVPEALKYADENKAKSIKTIILM